MLHTKDHYDLMEQFERTVRASSLLRLQFDKEDKALWSKGIIYAHGATNDAFIAYRLGYAYGRAIERMEAP